MKTKKIIFSSLALLLTSSLIASYFIIKSNKTNDEIETQVQENGIKIKRISSIENDDGSLIQTFSFSVKPDDATSDLVKVDVSYIDGTSCNEVVDAIVDNDENIITVTCKNPFSKQIILTVTALSNKDIYSNVSIDYLQRWPVAESKYDDNIEEPWYIGEDYENIEDNEAFPIKNFRNGFVNFNELFVFDYGTYSKEVDYTFEGIGEYKDFGYSGKVIDYSKKFSEELKNQMIEAFKDLLFEKSKEGFKWSKELIWNLIDSSEYKTSLYNSMISYEYEDCYSRIELTMNNFSLVYKNPKGEINEVGYLNKAKFILNITTDYSSLITSISSLNLELSSIEF